MIIMTRNISEILNRIPVPTVQNFIDSNKKYHENNIDFKEYVSELIFAINCFLLNKWNNCEKFRKKYPFFPYTCPDTIMVLLNNLDISTKNIIYFLDWYFKRFVEFYTNPDNKDIFSKGIVKIFKLIAIIENLLSEKNEQIRLHNLQDLFDNLNYYNSLEIQVLDTETMKIINSKEDQEIAYKMYKSNVSASENMKKENDKENGTPYSSQYEYLKYYGLSQSTIDKIFTIKVLKSAESKDTSDDAVVTDSTNCVKEPLKTPKSTYDYKAMEREVSEVIDFNGMFPKQPLSKKQEIYYVALLSKMGVSREQRSLFLRNSEMLKGSISPILKYLDNLERLKFYEESVGLQKEISFMNDCFQECTKCDSKDFAFWEDNLGNELKKVENWIPKNFEYEEEQAKLVFKKE